MLFCDCHLLLSVSTVTNATSDVAAVAVATAFAVVSTSIATAILRMQKQLNSVCYRELPGEVCYC